MSVPPHLFVLSTLITPLSTRNKHSFPRSCYSPSGAEDHTPGEGREGPRGPAHHHPPAVPEQKPGDAGVREPGKWWLWGRFLDGAQLRAERANGWHLKITEAPHRAIHLLAARLRAGLAESWC